MTKQEQINNLIKRLEDVESTNTRLSKDQRRDAIDNIERYGRLMKLFDKHKRDINRLNTIVERLDELLGKGINDYIMGIDGVEGLKDMWERSAVREFAGKLKTRLEAKEQHYICMYDWNGHSAVTDCENEVDELLKEYE